METVFDTLNLQELLLDSTVFNSNFVTVQSINFLELIQS